MKQPLTTLAPLACSLLFTLATPAQAALQWGGVDDWRLPASSTCLGFNCRGSEMGALWYTTLGHAAGVTPASQAPFQQVRSAPYWTGTPLAGAPGMAWYFNAQGGSQNVFPLSAQAHAVAVRTGDVALVPEPPAAAQWLAGWAGLVALGRRPGRRNA